MRSIHTFDEFFTYVYLPHAKARKRSWALEERLATRHISPTLGHRQLTEIKPGDIEQWLSGLRARGLAASSCNRIFAVLKSLFALAASLEYLPRTPSPCKDIKLLKLPPQRERYLSKKEGRQLMIYLRSVATLQSKMIQLLLLTGARKGEIRLARWEHLDWERRILTIPVSKSGRARRIYLSEEALEIFKSIVPQEESPWIFPGRNPQKAMSDIYHFWNRIRIRLGFKDVRMHDLRHSFASFLVSDGQTLYAVQQLLGHVDPRTTMRYAHFAAVTLLAAAGRVMHILGERKASYAAKTGSGLRWGQRERLCVTKSPRWGR